MKKPFRKYEPYLVLSNVEDLIRLLEEYKPRYARKVRREYEERLAETVSHRLHGLKTEYIRTLCGELSKLCISGFRFACDYESGGWCGVHYT